MRTALFVALALMPSVGFAETGSSIVDDSWSTTPQQSEETTVIPEGKATIIVEQISLVPNVQGSWLLSLPDHTQRTGNVGTDVLTDMPSGNYVVYANLPNGTVSTIRIYRNGTLDTLYERQQTPFALYPDEEIRISIHYRLDKTGTVAVQSDPPGAPFTLFGPDNATYQGVTPQSYEGLPEGQYKLQYEAFADGCVKPAPKAGQLVKDSRVSFDVKFDCDAANKVRERLGKDSKKYLTISADGQNVQLQDVLQSDWFSTYVFESAKRGILSGYKDAEGNPTGTFGPANNVTVAELSKIAHRMAGISEEAFANTTPKNTAGAGQWFSPFFASAENRGWIIYAEGTIDPTRPATRGEVLATLMQAFDVPLHWQKGNVFTDVPVMHPFAAAIETAAKDGVITGRKNADGTSTGTFDPDASITRAEIAKIITTILSTYKSPTSLRNAANRQPKN